MRDHVVTGLLESKNLSKRAKKRRNSLNFDHFLFLEALKPHGRAGNLKNQLKRDFSRTFWHLFRPSSFVNSADILCFVCFLAIFHSKRPLAKFLNYVRWSTIHFPTFDMHFVNSFFSFNGYFVVFVKLSKPKTLKTGKKWGKIFQSAILTILVW